MNVFSTEETGGLARNLSYAIVAQGVGLLSSILTSLVLPKFLGLDDYAYWQLFLLYSSYSGFALLGLNDGIYLRLGGKRYNDLPHEELKAQQLVVIASQLLVALVCFVLIAFSGFDFNRTLVFVFVVVLGLLGNLTQCLRYVFQCTNLTRISSLADLIAKGLFIACMAALLIGGIQNFLPFVAGYTVCQGLALAYVLICARRTLAAKAEFTAVLATCISDIKAGLKIMVAYYADSLIVGFTRMLADWKLGLAVFGKLSLSFSVTNFVLTFIGQVAMVAFPVLKRLGSEGQRDKYLLVRGMLHIFLPAVYLTYVPIRVVLGIWLPDYADSFVYLALTMPLCIYNCKASLLFNNYLKMERAEGRLCAINVFTMVLNGVVAYIAISFGGVVPAVVGIVLCVAVRDFVFERHMHNRFGVGYIRLCGSQIVLSICFVAASWFMGNWSFLVVLVLLAAYWAFWRSDAKEVLSYLQQRLVRKRTA